MKQKFGKLTFIRVSEDMPISMRFFDSGFNGIVDATYSQMYGGNDVSKYFLYKIEGGKVVNKIGWYKENQITMLDDQDKEKAEQMIEAYNLGG